MNFFKYISVITLFSFSQSLAASSADQLGKLWKTLIKDPSKSHSCEGMNLLGIANESPLVSVFVLFTKKGEMKIPQRDLKPRRRGNIEIKRGEILAICTNYSEMYFSLGPNRKKNLNFKEVKRQSRKVFYESKKFQSLYCKKTS